MLHAALQLAIAFPFAPDERSVAFLPFFACIPEQVLPALLAGGSIDCIRRFDEERIAARARTGDELRRRADDHGAAARLAGRRRAARACAGSCSPPSRCRVPLLERWWDALPGVETHQLYGMTEMLTISQAPHRRAARAPDQRRAARTRRRRSRSSTRTASRCPPGTAGEVTCASPALMRGYLDDPDATAAAPTPAGAIRTGDLAYLDDDGLLHLKGRLKDLIISGGMNVAPGRDRAGRLPAPARRDRGRRRRPARRAGARPRSWSRSRRRQHADAAPTSSTSAARELAGFKRPTAAALVDVAAADRHRQDREGRAPRADPRAGRSPLSAQADFDALLERHRAGEGWGPLARAITLVENTPPWRSERAGRRPSPSTSSASPVPPGAGKSTLTGAADRVVQRRGRARRGARDRPVEPDQRRRGARRPGADGVGDLRAAPRSSCAASRAAARSARSRPRPATSRALLEAHGLVRRRHHRDRRRGPDRGRGRRAGRHRRARDGSRPRRRRPGDQGRPDGGRRHDRREHGRPARRRGDRRATCA